MILINVLIIVMLATTVLAIMLVGEDTDIERSSRLRSAAQAMATARGAELSAIAALRRDLASGSVTDTLREPWANIGDQDIEIAGGQFTFAVSDAQARFNINTLVGSGPSVQAVFAQIAAAADMPPDTSSRIASLLQATGPIDDLSQLQLLGFSQPELARLAVFCTLLPEPTPVNLNTAREPLISILLANPAAARTLVSMRTRAGELNRDELMASAILLPPGTSLDSGYFWARAKISNGAATQQLTTLMVRRAAEESVVVLPIRRWRGAPPLHAPAL